MMMNDNGTTPIDDQLEEALALLAAGIPVDDILTEAGAAAEWLRPLLKIATDVGELKTAVPVPAPEASLQRMLAYGRELTATTPPPPVPAQQNWLTTLVTFLSTGWLPRLTAGLASALLLVILMGGTLTVLAQRSLPGQPLYGLKRVVENVRLSLTLNPEDHAQLLENYNLQRQAETKLLLQQNEVATVSFSGLAEAVTETTLTLGGLTLQLTPQTQVKGTLAAGAHVQVEALTQPPDHLTALTITVIESAPPTPTPLLSPTSTPSPTATVTATATRSLSNDTDTLILPTLTPTPAPTDTPPPPTATLAPPQPTAPTDDNINGGGNEGGGDSGINNGNENQNGPEDNGSSPDNSNGNSGGDDSLGRDNSGSGSDNSGGGGVSGEGGGGNSGHSGSGGGGGGDDHGND